MTKNPVPPHGRQTWDLLQEVAKFGYSSSQVFSDFVDTVLATLLSFTHNFELCGFEEFKRRLNENAFEGPYEERYMGIVRRYKENSSRPQGQRPVDFFAKAWGALDIETQQSQKDVLGDLYESQISLGEHGQFFTPDHLAQMIAEMLGGKDGETVLEPACGSGKLILGAANKNRNRLFTGIDKSPVCARMCVLNMWLYGLSANIYEGDTLTMEMSYLWVVRGAWIWERKIEKERRPETSAKKQSTLPPPTLKPAKEQPPENVMQQSLFDM